MPGTCQIASQVQGVRAARRAHLGCQHAAQLLLDGGAHIGDGGSGGALLVLGSWVQLLLLLLRLRLHMLLLRLVRLLLLLALLLLVSLLLLVVVLQHLLQQRRCRLGLLWQHMQRRRSQLLLLLLLVLLLLLLPRCWLGSLGCWHAACRLLGRAAARPRGLLSIFRGPPCLLSRLAASLACLVRLRALLLLVLLLRLLLLLRGRGARWRQQAHSARLEGRQVV